MELVHIDLETAYQVGTYSLTNLGTHRYVLDPRFQLIGMGIQWPDDRRPTWHTRRSLEQQLQRLRDHQRELIQVSFNCLTPDHEFLSPTGWVRMDAWNGEAVAQWSLSGEVQFTAPLAYIRKPYRGDMLEFHTLFHKGRYTPDHRVPMRQTSGNRQWIFSTAAEAAVSPVNNREIPSAGILHAAGIDFTDDELRLLVAVRADGSFGGARAIKQHAPCFQLQKTRKLARVVELLVACGVTYTITELSDAIRVVRTHAGPVISKIRNLLGRNKTYGAWVLEATPHQRRVMIEEEQMWDGRRNPKRTRGAVSLHSTQMEVVDWIQAMAATSGMRTRATTDIPNTKGFNEGHTDRTIHYVSVADRDHVRLRPDGGRSAEVTNYQGEVFCFTVPSGAFIVRRGGAVWVTGNCTFDASVLDWQFDFRAAELACPMAMARSLGLDKVSGLSLDALGQLAIEAGADLPRKGHEVVMASGKWLDDFSPGELADYGRYCVDDTRISRGLFDLFAELLQPEELMWQSAVMQMFVHRPLRLNRGIVERELERVNARRAADLAMLCQKLGVDNEALLLKVVGSGAKLAEAITLFGGKVPMKVSPANGKQTYAFAKTDGEFLAMLEHPVPEVAALVAARLGLKSSIEQTRCVKFLELETFGPLPVPVKVSGAHTHRLSGEGDWNPQNLPSGRKPGQSKALKESIEVPVGYVVTGGDSSQVEVRVMDYVSGDIEALEEFRRGVCPYSSLALRLWPAPGIEPGDVKRLAKAGDEYWGAKRQLGKTIRLGAQFGIGPRAFRDYAETQAGIVISWQEAKQYVKGFRTSKPAAPKFWRTCDNVLKLLADGEGVEFGGPSGKLLIADPHRKVLGKKLPGIRLPDGMWLSYPDLEFVEMEEWVDVIDDDTGDVIDRRKEWRTKARFWTRKGRSSIPVYTHGATLTENIVQALAFAAMKHQASLLEFPLVFQEHDAHYVISSIEEAAWADKNLGWAMTQPPPWAPDLPLACEKGQAGSIGKIVKR